MNYFSIICCYVRVISKLVKVLLKRQIFCALILKDYKTYIKSYQIISNYESINNYLILTLFKSNTKVNPFIDRCFGELKKCLQFKECKKIFKNLSLKQKLMSCPQNSKKTKQITILKLKF